jgi:hypothetical protein
MATTYDVCLVVSSAALTLPELTHVMGLEGASGSHNKGDEHLLKSRGPWKTTVWKLCSREAREAPLDEHFDDIVAQLDPGHFQSAIQRVADAEVYISIGVFSNAQIPEAGLSRHCLAIADAFRASIDVSLYVHD